RSASRHPPPADCAASGAGIRDCAAVPDALEGKTFADRPFRLPSRGDGLLHRWRPTAGGAGRGRGLPDAATPEASKAGIWPGGGAPQVFLRGSRKQKSSEGEECCLIPFGASATLTWHFPLLAQRPG